MTLLVEACEMKLVKFTFFKGGRSLLKLAKKVKSKQ